MLVLALAALAKRPAVRLRHRTIPPIPAAIRTVISFLGGLDHLPPPGYARGTS